MALNDVLIFQQVKEVFFFLVVYLILSSKE